MKASTKKITTSALLIAAEILLTRVLAINTSVMKIGLGFIAVAICSSIYGPWWGALVAALADIIGSLIFPTGAYFPGFTASAAITGIIFGFSFYKKTVTLKNSLLASLSNSVIVSFLLNSVMISFISGTPVLTLLKVRVVQILIMFPVQFVIFYLILPRIIRKIP